MPPTYYAFDEAKAIDGAALAGLALEIVKHFSSLQASHSAKIEGGLKELYSRATDFLNQRFEAGEGKP